MAQFLPKEQVSAGATGSPRASGGNIAQDFGKLFSALGQGLEAQTKIKSAENARVGTLYAQDQRIQLIEKLKKQEIALIENNGDVDYEAYKQEMDEIVANAQIQAKDKFGGDSTAYRSFEDNYLLYATEKTEDRKVNLFAKQEEYTNEKLYNTASRTINEYGDELGKEGIDIEVGRMLMGGATDVKASAYVTDILYGKMQNSGVNPKDFYGEDGKVNMAKVKETFNRHFSSIATLDDDMSVTSKHPWLQEDDLAKLKNNFVNMINGQAEKETYNMNWKIKKDDIGKDLGSFTPSGNQEKDLERFHNLQSSVWKELTRDTNNPSNTDKAAATNLWEDINRKKQELGIAYQVASRPSEIASSLEDGFYTDIKGNRVEVNSDYLKAVVQTELSKKLSVYEETKDPRVLVSLAQYEQQTGVKSTELQTAFRRVSSLTGSPEQMVETLNIAKTLQDDGYNLPNQPIFDKDTMIQAENILSDDEYKKGEKIKKVTNLIATRNKERHELKEEDTQQAIKTTTEIFQDASFLEETARGYFASFFTLDNFSDFNSRIYGGVSETAQVYATFASANNMIVDPSNKDGVLKSVEKLMTGSTSESGDPLFALPKMSGDSVVTKSVDSDYLFGALKKRFGGEEFVERMEKEDMVVKYQLDGTDEIVMEVYARTNDIIEGTPRLTLTHDNYNEVITKEIKAQVQEQRTQEKANEKAKVKVQKELNKNLISMTDEEREAYFQKNKR